jgi:PAS domain S-box-containing protein
VDEWVRLLQTLGGLACFGSFVALVTVVLKYVLKSRAQYLPHLVKRVEDLEKAIMECLEERRLLDIRVAGLEAMIKSSEQVIANVVCDENGMITEWNDSATTMFGWSKAEATGKDVSMLVPMRLRGTHGASFRRAVAEKRGPLATSAATVRESYALTKSGMEIPVTIVLNGWQYDDKLFYSAEIKKR